MFGTRPYNNDNGDDSMMLCLCCCSCLMMMMITMLIIQTIVMIYNDKCKHNCTCLVFVLAGMRDAIHYRLLETVSETAKSRDLDHNAVTGGPQNVVEYLRRILRRISPSSVLGAHPILKNGGVSGQIKHYVRICDIRRMCF